MFSPALTPWELAIHRFIFSALAPFSPWHRPGSSKCLELEQTISIRRRRNMKAESESESAQAQRRGGRYRRQWSNDLAAPTAIVEGKSREECEDLSRERERRREFLLASPLGVYIAICAKCWEFLYHTFTEKRWKTCKESVLKMQELEMKFMKVINLIYCSGLGESRR